MFLLSIVSLGQSVFEIISLIVKRVMNLVEDQNDRHGRNALLTAYIDYMCRVPYLSGGTTPQQATSKRCQNLVDIHP